MESQTKQNPKQLNRIQKSPVSFGVGLLYVNKKNLLSLRETLGLWIALA